MGVVVPRSLQNSGLINPEFIPYGNLKLKHSNKFVRGLIVCCVPQSGDPLKTINLVDGKEPLSSTGTASIKPTPRGKEIAGVAAGVAYDVTGLMPSPLVFTCYCLTKRTTNPNANISIMSVGSVSSSDNRLEVGVRGSGAGDPYNVFYKDSGVSYTLRPGSTNINEYMPIFATRYAPDDLVVNYIDGSLDSANATFGAGNSIGDIPVDNISFMSFYKGGVWQVDTDNSLKLGLLWNRDLSQSDIEEFMRNPTQIFEFE